MTGELFIHVGTMLIEKQACISNSGLLARMARIRLSTLATIHSIQWRRSSLAQSLARTVLWRLPAVTIQLRRDPLCWLTSIRVWMGLLRWNALLPMLFSLKLNPAWNTSGMLLKIKSPYRPDDGLTIHTRARYRFQRIFSLLPTASIGWSTLKPNQIRSICSGFIL